MRRLVRSILCAAAIVGSLAGGATAQTTSAPPAPTASSSGAGTPPAPQCTPRSGLGPGRPILNGEDAPDERSTVGIRFNGGEICTGVVIAPGVVLTAGHCSCGNPAGYRLYFGKEMQNPGTPQIGVRSVERHPDYRCALVNQPQPGVDYAIIRFDLTNPEVANEYEEAVAMPVARARELVATFRVVGYGFTHRQGEWGNRQRANVPVASWDCTDRFAEGRGCQPFSEFILSDLGDAGARGTGKLKDSCGGDSGGPAFAVVQEDDGCGGRRSVSYLVGITSRGIKLKSSDGFNKKCGGGGVYEVVARKSIASWLQGLRVPFVVPEMSPLSTLNQ